MRVAYVVDVHGHQASVAEALARVGEIDLLIVGGDITTAGTADEAERAIESWRPLAPRLLAVSGNMDSRAIDERLAELDVALDGRGFRFGDVGVFGVSAAPVSPLRTPYELSDDELDRRIRSGFEEVRDARVTVLLPACAAGGHGV